MGIVCCKRQKPPWSIMREKKRCRCVCWGEIYWKVTGHLNYRKYNWLSQRAGTWNWKASGISLRLCLSHSFLPPPLFQRGFSSWLYSGHQFHSPISVDSLSLSLIVHDWEWFQYRQPYISLISSAQRLLRRSYFNFWLLEKHWNGSTWIKCPPWSSLLGARGDGMSHRQKQAPLPDSQKSVVI